jgi:hypothetical protein
MGELGKRLVPEFGTHGVLKTRTQINTFFKFSGQCGVAVVQLLCCPSAAREIDIEDQLGRDFGVLVPRCW